MKLETKINKLKDNGFIVLEVYKDELLKYGKDIEDVLGLRWRDNHSLTTEVVEDVGFSYPIRLYTLDDSFRYIVMEQTFDYDGIKVFANLFELLEYLEIPLRPEGFIIRNIAPEDWDTCIDTIMKINPEITWYGGMPLDSLFVDLPSNFTLRVDKDEAWLLKPWAIPKDVVVYESLKDYVDACIGNPEDEDEEEEIDRYEELRNDGFEIADITAEDLKHEVFKALKLTWRSGEPVAELESAFYAPFYLRFLPHSFTGATWGYNPAPEKLDSTELHRFKSFQEFLDYLGWEG